MSSTGSGNSSMSASMRGGSDSVFSGLSGMQLTFLVTGVVGGVAAVLGVVYLILYHTRMSNSSRRKMMRQNNNQDMGMRLSLREESKRRDSRRDSGGRRSNTQTHFSLFKAKR